MDEKWRFWISVEPKKPLASKECPGHRLNESSLWVLQRSSLTASRRADSDLPDAIKPQEQCQSALLLKPEATGSSNLVNRSDKCTHGRAEFRWGTSDSSLEKVFGWRALSISHHAREAYRKKQ